VWLRARVSVKLLKTGRIRIDYLDHSQDPEAFLCFLGVAIVGIALFLVGRSFTPVYLLDAHEQTIRVRIRNEEYARDFKQANAPWIEERTK
jgi:hypothetical protein